MEAIITLDKVQGQRWLVRVKLPISFLTAYEQYKDGNLGGLSLNRLWGRPCYENSVPTAFRFIERSFLTRSEACSYIDKARTAIATATTELQASAHREWSIPLNSLPATTSLEEVDAKEVERATLLCKEMAK